MVLQTRHTLEGIYKPIQLGSGACYSSNTFFLVRVFDQGMENGIKTGNGEGGLGLQNTTDEVLGPGMGQWQQRNHPPADYGSIVPTRFEVFDHYNQKDEEIGI